MTVDTMDKLVHSVFPDLTDERLFANRAILAPRNQDADEVNAFVVDQGEGDVQQYKSKSIDSVSVDDGTLYPTEYLNSLSPSGLPLHLLKLKVGSPIITLRNLNSDDGLCNGTRMTCRAFARHVIDAEIVSGTYTDRRVFILRIELTPSGAGLPFTLRR